MCQEEILQKGRGTIYHELGHVFGYCLANKNENTYLGEITEIFIGVNKNAVILENSCYHYEKPNESIEAIRHHTAQKQRTIAWFIEVISGCTFQSIYQSIDFELCFGGEESKIGYFDYSNVASIARYSSFYYSLQEIFAMQNKYHQYLLDNKILDFFTPRVNEITSMLSESNECQISLNNQEIKQLVRYIDGCINKKMHNEYLKIIKSF